MKKLTAIAALCLALAGCGSLGSQSLVDAALRHEGKTARQLGLPATLWCADAANVFRKEAGFKPTNSRRAIDQLAYAQRIRTPVPGSLQITTRGRGGHHVDVVLANHGNGTLTVIGGNVNGAVTRRVVLASGIFVQPLREGEQAWRVFK